MNKFNLHNVLITGCGGDIAIAMARILREILPGVCLVGTDIHDDHPAQSYFDSVVSVVRADDPGYYSCMEKVIREHNIDLIVPSTEAEIAFLVRNSNPDAEFGVPVLMASNDIVQTGLDKLKTSEYLRDMGVLSPWTVQVDQGVPLNYPCIIKPRIGCGSKNIAKVDQDTVSKFSGFGGNYIWQEYLYPDNEEYTCGIFRSEQGDIRTLIIKRQLQGGLTGKGVVVENAAISQLLEQLATDSCLVGSINAQLRLTNKGPVIFEINPRFSSTVMFRHKMGFKDLLWSLEDRFKHALSNYVAPKTGTRFYRVANEVIYSA